MQCGRVGACRATPACSGRCGACHSCTLWARAWCWCDPAARSVFMHVGLSSIVACEDEKCMEVWKKGKQVPPHDPSVWRKDVCGAWIKFEDYGTDTEHGWVQDHIRPKALGGSDQTSNLQPLHHKNNRAKSDTVLKCVVTACDEPGIPEVTMYQQIDLPDSTQKHNCCIDASGGRGS